MDLLEKYKKLYSVYHKGPFSLGEIQNACVVIGYFKEFAIKELEILIEMNGQIFARRCLSCNGYMMPSEVNTAPGNQTGDDSIYVWTCQNCLNQIFSSNTLEEEFAIEMEKLIKTKE
jgi:hypothetical protein